MPNFYGRIPSKKNRDKRLLELIKGIKDQGDANSKFGGSNIAYGQGAASGDGGNSNDELVKVSSTDTTHGYLSDKLVAGRNVVLTTLSPAGDEQYEISAIEIVASLPAWAGTDEGRVLYAQDTNQLSYGSDTAWVTPGGSIAHTDLTDMPSALNSDHDGRYYTESEANGLFVSAHALLSAVHTDTTAASVLRGALIVGVGVTPKWTLLAFPATPTGKFLQCGVNEPGWSGWALPAAIGSVGQFLKYDGTWDTPADDHKVLASATDSTPAVLYSKVTGSGSAVVTLVGGAGTNQTVNVAVPSIPAADDHKVMATSVDSTPDYLASKLTGSGLVGITTTGGSGTDQKTNVDVPAYTEGNGIDITGTAVTALVTEGPGISVTCAGPGLYQVVSSKAPWITVPKTADQSKTSDNTIANDSMLVFTAAAASTYIIRGSIHITESGTNDFQWSILDTQAPVSAYGKYEYILPSALTTLVVTQTSALPSAVVMDSTGNGNGWIQFEYTINTHATNSGTVGFAWAQRTSGLGAATVRKGSYIEVQKIA
jgi:hypothetical protein